jgi:Ca2+-binding RTX toxin-like protein
VASLGHDIFWGGYGNDAFWTMYDDTFYGGPGNDYVESDSSATVDWVAGQEGDDSLNVNQVALVTWSTVESATILVASIVRTP